MNENKEVEQLLRNIQEGLKKFTLKELNDAIVDFFNKKDDKSKEVDFILEIVSKDFNTSIRTLKDKNGKREISEARQFAYCMLHYNLGLSTRYIAEKVFINHWHTVVHRAIVRLKNAQPNVKADRDFLSKYKELNEKFIDRLTKNQNTLENAN